MHEIELLMPCALMSVLCFHSSGGVNFICQNSTIHVENTLESRLNLLSSQVSDLSSYQLHETSVVFVLKLPDVIYS